jgi:hypothetical protein
MKYFIWTFCGEAVFFFEYSVFSYTDGRGLTAASHHTRSSVQAQIRSTIIAKVSFPKFALQRAQPSDPDFLRSLFHFQA